MFGSVRQPCHFFLDPNPFRIKAEEEEEDLLDAYATPGKVRHILYLVNEGTTSLCWLCSTHALLCPQSSQKRALTTPEHPQSKRSAALLASPGLLLSPASFSPRYLFQNTGTLLALQKQHRSNHFFSHLFCKCHTIVKVQPARSKRRSGGHIWLRTGHPLGRKQAWGPAGTPGGSWQHSPH